MHQAMDRSKAKERYAAGKMRQHSTRALFFIGGFGAASWLTRPASMQPLACWRFWWPCRPLLQLMYTRKFCEGGWELSYQSCETVGKEIANRGLT